MKEFEPGDAAMAAVTVVEPCPHAGSEARDYPARQKVVVANAISFLDAAPILRLRQRPEFYKPSAALYSN